MDAVIHLTAIQKKEQGYKQKEEEMAKRIFKFSEKSKEKKQKPKGFKNEVLKLIIDIIMIIYTKIIFTAFAFVMGFSFMKQF